MRLENRGVSIHTGASVSTVWAFPDNPGHVHSAVILAHGAGNDMQHPFISHFHEAFADAGLLSVKFNFLYSEQGRRAPDRMPLLEATWRAVIKAVRAEPVAPRLLFLAGKSMGGRVASHLVAEGEVCDGLIFLGYPLHPAKQPEKLRVAHWSGLHRPMLFVQGSRDALCDLSVLKAELPQLPGPVTLQVIDGGDHSYKVAKAHGISQPEVLRTAADVVTAWILRTASAAVGAT